MPAPRSQSTSRAPDPSAYSDDLRPVRVRTALADVDFFVVGMRAEERVSSPFSFTLDLLSPAADVDAGELLHKPAVIALRLSSGDERNVHGLVRSFAHVGKAEDLSSYRMHVVPALWFLSLSSDCRTFENKTALEIVEEVCEGGGVKAIRRATTGEYAPRPFCVQYRETNLAFVSRLLEEEGVFYFFEHTDGAHTLVLADAPSAVKPTPGIDKLGLGWSPSMVLDGDVVSSLEREHAVHSASVALRDYDPMVPQSSAVKAGAERSGEARGAVGEAYDFPGDVHKTDLGRTALRQIERAEVSRDVVRGASDCAAVASGHTVTVEGAGPGGAALKLHVVEVTHSLSGADVRARGGSAFAYQNSFVAIPAATPYRPPRSTEKPLVRGSHTAWITGSVDIDVDADARVLLKFPWDRGAGKEGKSAYRVRVASAWAGTQWGFVQIPRVGQEVLVDFLEGDPDRPIVTGRVYNADHKPPYTLPANATQSGWKSRSVGSGSGADNYNEVRFEDKKDGEEVHVQAEKDLSTVVKHDETRDVRHDRATTIKNDDTRTVSDGNDTLTVSKGDQKVTVRAGKQVLTVHGDQTTTIEQGSQSTTVKAGDVTTKVSAGKCLVEALQSIELKVGGSSIKLEPSGVTIKALNVKIQGDVTAEVQAVMTKVQASGVLTVQGSLVQIN